MTVELDETDLARLARSGLSPMSSEEGLALFDESCERDNALLLPARLDFASLRAQARKGSLRGPLRGLVPAFSRRVMEGDSLSRRLGELPESERRAVVLELVQSEMGIVLGESLSNLADPERPFNDLGFTSLTGMELRNRLSEATGLRLPSTLVFDYPTPALVASALLEQVSSTTPEGDGEEREIRRVLALISVDQLRDAGLMAPLLKLAGVESHEASTPRSDDNVMQQIESMDLDDLVQRALQTSGPNGKDI
jgi:hypothetical protein